MNLSSKEVKIIRDALVIADSHFGSCMEAMCDEDLRDETVKDANKIIKALDLIDNK